MHDSGPVQILIILHVLCVAPGNKHNQKPCINSMRSREFPDQYTAFVSVNTWQLILCNTGINAIIYVKNIEKVKTIKFGKIIYYVEIITNL